MSGCLEMGWRDAHCLDCGVGFMSVYMSKCIKLYTLNMYSICQLYLNKAIEGRKGGKKEGGQEESLND